MIPASLYLRIVPFLAMGILLTACRDNSSEVPPSALQSLLRGEQAELCSLRPSTLQDTHLGFVCDAHDGYRYHVDLPRSGEISVIVIVLHVVNDVQSLLMANSDNDKLTDVLFILPEAKTWSVLGKLLTANLWNGSGERHPFDNGCCVDSMLGDRDFVAELIEDVTTTLPGTARYVIGLSNGGMLALDLLYNTDLDVNEYFILVASDQTNTWAVSSPTASVTIIGIHDDEIIPFFGGPIASTEYIGHINASNSFVTAPSFTDTYERLRTGLACDMPASLSVSPLAQGVITEHTCRYGSLTGFELTQGGHRLGAADLATATPQRRDVIGHIFERMGR